MMRWKLTVMLLILPLLLNGQSKLDSLRGLLKTSQDTARVGLLIGLAKEHKLLSPDSTIYYSKEAMLLAKKIDDTHGLVEALFMQGQGQEMRSEFDSGLFYYGQAEALLKEDPNTLLLADVYTGYGGIYYYKDLPFEAMEYFIKATELYETFGDPELMVASYSNVAIVLNANGQDEKALKYFHKALVLSEKYDLIDKRLPVLVNLASYYEYREQYDSARYYADACYQISKSQGFKYGMARALLILPSVYAANEFYSDALRTAREGKALFEELGDETRALRMTFFEAEALQGLGEPRAALALCLNYLDKGQDMDIFIEDVYELTAAVYADLGMAKESLAYRKMFFDKYKEATIEQHRGEISELETRYDTEKKSKEIETLNALTEIQELRIEQQNLWIGLGGLAFVLVLILVLLFFRQRDLRKKNEVLSLEQKLLRFQMSPHFIFNALGAIQGYIIKNDPLKGTSFLAKFSNLMRQVLEHSRESTIPLEEEVNALTNYLDLQKLRFDNRFDYEIKVSEELDLSETRIPPMFAQPFIENSLEHGISGMTKGGRVEVVFSRVGDNIQVVISDNGTGMKETETVKNGHRSLASIITKERIQMLSATLGRKASLAIKNLKDDTESVCGVEVSITLPIVD
ncbi:MAG: hypothetical protein Roseis2KO_16530 [Roseivirga sp.]